MVFADKVIHLFLGGENHDNLKKSLINRYRCREVVKFLDDNLRDQMKNYGAKYKREMSTSDMIDGLTMGEILDIINTDFLRYLCSYIQDYVYVEPELEYTLSDGMPTGRGHDNRPTEEIIKEWSTKASRDITYRDDRDDHSNYNFASRGSQYTDIEVCNTENMNDNTLIDQIYGHKNFKRLNEPRLWEGAFGHSTSESDARLLSRRIFRNEGGVENGIPKRQQYTHHRNVDRTSEGLRPSEREYINNGFDMSSLRGRVSERRHAIGNIRMTGTYP